MFLKYSFINFSLKGNLQLKDLGGILKYEFATGIIFK